MSGPRFYFAWVGPTDTTFLDAYKREDEKVFSLTLQQAEGDFAALDVDLRNPRIGLLSPARKQWAWLAYRAANGTVTPLFFGRLIGVPQDMQNDIVRLSFIARPTNYESQLTALAASLRVAPYYDPLWFSAQEDADPARALEAYTALYHIDRITHVVTASDIIRGEDGSLDFSPSEVPRDSVSVSYSTSPASQCTVTAQVQWTQKGSGDIDVTRDLLDAFAAMTTAGVVRVDGGPAPKDGMVNLIAGDTMVAAWPPFGTAIGGGWSVGASFAQTIGNPPLPPILVGNFEAMHAVSLWKDNPGSRNALREIFDRSPGFVVGIEDTSIPWTEHGWLSHGDINVMWLPVWQIAIGMKLHYEASRQRSETLSFTLTADVQPLLTDPGADEVILLNLGPADVDSVIDVRSPRFFGMDRGTRSVTHLLARARAHLIARARAIDVSWSMSFERGLALTCRKNASVQDPRIPGGVAAGKIKAYTLVWDGDQGGGLASVTIGATVGKNGHVEVVLGTPDYCEFAYVGADYQTTTGGVKVPFAGDLGYSISGTYSIADDGVNLFAVNKPGYLAVLEAHGGLDEQKAAIGTSAAAASSTAGVMDKINSVTTTVKIVMRPVSGGPFDSEVALLSLSTLKIPRTIDLEDTTFTAVAAVLGHVIGAIHVTN